MKLHNLVHTLHFHRQNITCRTSANRSNTALFVTKRETPSPRSRIMQPRIRFASASSACRRNTGLPMPSGRAKIFAALGTLSLSPLPHTPPRARLPRIYRHRHRRRRRHFREEIRQLQWRMRAAGARHWRGGGAPGAANPRSASRCSCSDSQAPHP